MASRPGMSQDTSLVLRPNLIPYLAPSVADGAAWLWHLSSCFCQMVTLHITNVFLAFYSRSLSPLPTSLKLASLIPRPIFYTHSGKEFPSKDLTRGPGAQKHFLSLSLWKRVEVLWTAATMVCHIALDPKILGQFIFHITQQFSTCFPIYAVIPACC